MQRDSLDFRNMSVGRLFTRQLIPNILGMMSSALFIIVDGIFVGRGIGSDAMAAVNIVAPLSMIMAGVGLMFGTGGSVLASINLSRGKERLANINITQSFAVSLLFTVILAALILLLPEYTVRLFGAEDRLVAPAVEYLFWFTIALPFMVLGIVLPFFVRLTNPNFAMWSMLIATGINIVLDYLFIFEFGWGLAGAAVATGLGELVGCLMLILYLFRKSITVRFTRFKTSMKSIRLTLRNAWYMVRLGFPTFLSEATIAVMAISGNYVFMRYLGTDGVAAFSIICYLFPIIFMVFNATVQSAQPIISFNYGCGQMDRANLALRKAIATTTGIGMFVALCSVFLNEQIVSLFVPDTANAAWGYAVTGLPLFATDYIFFGFNVVTIGYYISIEKIKRATLLTILRGILPVIFFHTLPMVLSVSGIWLAVGAGDVTTTIFIVILALRDKKRAHEKTGRRTQPVR
ncbi:MATE family efflux transporter [Alistipes sp. OttesenSCG-928-B03]|nr:MATE family efflux transporter [Alistipes sp. OttesenSCG-928-B03]